jgi:hypothetical protein
MDAVDIAWWRMNNLGLTGTTTGSPLDTLHWLGAVQSQDYRPATWSLAHRSDGVDHAHIDQLFDVGQILRTHVLRPTWHFVHRDDIRLLLQVTGPRVKIASQSRYKSNKVDQDLLDRCNQHIITLLAGQNHRTRNEIRGELETRGIELDTGQMNCVMLDAELTGIVCSGRLSGKEQTYALLDERAPKTGELDPDEALAEFTRRYFTSHGPATIHDFRSWGSLTVAEIRRGIEMLGAELESMECDGLTYWYVHGPSSSRPDAPHVSLLQRFDEYLSGYLQSRGVIDQAGRYADLNPDRMSGGPLVIDSQISGHWHRTVTKTSVKLEFEHRVELGDREKEVVEAEAARFGAFLGLKSRTEFRHVIV